MRNREIKLPCGFTLVEILISIVIVSILLSVAVMMLSGGHSKKNLMDTGIGLVDALRRAQSEADRNKEVRGLCFKQNTSGRQYVQIYEPAVASTKLPTNLDCDGTDVGLGYTFNFRTDVTVCASCDGNIAINKSIFFNPQGMAVVQNGTRTNFEICLIHSKMASGTRTREVEVLALGIVKLLKLGETQSLTGVTVNSGSCN